VKPFISVLIYLLVFGVVPVVVVGGALHAREAGNDRAVDAQQTSSISDWRSEWATHDGFAISEDTTGYRFPVSIAFVPEPGEEPDSPLYYVLELRGRIQVVTRDRSVHTFVDKTSNFVPIFELPDHAGEAGAVGMCLDPQTGYIFVTTMYVDEQGERRNKVVRFSTSPKTFSKQPSARLDITSPFAKHPTYFAHQIGPCAVHDGHLWIGVGDAEQDDLGLNLESINGKVIRMTLDGKPARDNPYFKDDEIERASDFVWAYGFRNPFGLKFVGNRLLIADNGNGIDRIVSVEMGGNYLYDGTDRSITARADCVFAPSVSPVTMAHYTVEMDLFPGEWHNSLFVVLSGSPIDPPGAGKDGGRSITAFGYNSTAGHLTSVPSNVVEYRGQKKQVIFGLAFGPDGLYFAPLLPNKDGQSPILKLTHRPEDPHPFVLDTIEYYRESPRVLLTKKSCFGCHAMDDTPGMMGPSLMQPALSDRIAERLNSTEYLEKVQQLDAEEAESGNSFKEQRDEVLAAEGNERVRRWLIQHLLEPRFDEPYSRMPNPGLKPAEAEIAAEYLMATAWTVKNL
jgi:glucose/arabinose dehydrogenase